MHLFRLLVSANGLIRLSVAIPDALNPRLIVVVTGMLNTVRIDRIGWKKSLPTTGHFGHF